RVGDDEAAVLRRFLERNPEMNRYQSPGLPVRAVAPAPPGAEPPADGQQSQGAGRQKAEGRPAPRLRPRPLQPRPPARFASHPAQTPCAAERPEPAPEPVARFPPVDLSRPGASRPLPAGRMMGRFARPVTRGTPCPA